MSQSPTTSAVTIDVIQDAEPTALHRPYARRHYPQRISLFESSRMAREMHRL